MRPPPLNHCGMNVRRFALVVLNAGLILVLAAGSAAASERAAVMATIHQFVDGFNKGDTKSALAACASPTIIIDEFPPHEWHGPTACADWANAYNDNAKKDGITDGIVTLGEPWHVDVTGDRGYVVVPVKYAYKQHGKLVVESGSVFTVALKKVAAGWRITGWAWAKH
jgi:ketosteroid isomerase-like protein